MDQQKNRAFIALGSNIEPRDHYLRDAVQMISQRAGTILKQSPIYDTAPVGYVDQSSFLNMVIEIETTLSSMDLLTVCQDIEQDLGRIRTIDKGPRTVDLDILLFNDENSEIEKLLLPHPRMHERTFVLVPLCDIAPTIVHPLQNKTMISLLRELPEEALQDIKQWSE